MSKYPIRGKVKEGTIDFKEYNLLKNTYVGSNGRTYSLDDIEYLIIPKEEIEKTVNLLRLNRSKKQ